MLTTNGGGGSCGAGGHYPSNLVLYFDQGMMLNKEFVFRMYLGGLPQILHPRYFGGYEEFRTIGIREIKRIQTDGSREPVVLASTNFQLIEVLFIFVMIEIAE